MISLIMMNEDNDTMTAYMLKSGYRYRVFAGKTADKPGSPQKIGDIFVDVETGKNYISVDGSSWEETSIIITL